MKESDITGNIDVSIRYSRQIAIPEIGEKGQSLIRNGKILVVGCGALGSMVIMQLAAAGVGTLGFADFDNIEVSNLQRQFFFETSQAGESKVKVMTQRVKLINPDIKVEALSKLIDRKLAQSIFPYYDFIIDATDNHHVKSIIDEISLENQKPCCLAGVKNFSGQVLTLMPSDMRFYDIFENTEGGCFLPCSQGGVAGSATALCASIQASEAIKFLTGAGETLSGQLFTFNLLTNSYKVYRLN